MAFNQGKFIVVEGLEGAGKSTALLAIEKFLHLQQINLIHTREPGGTHVGEVIRHLFKEKTDGYTIDSYTELLLLYAARVQHIVEVIKPALAEGFCVVSDRFELSTIAYQGGGRNIPLSYIEALSNLTLNGFQPDLTFFLDIRPEIGLQRAKLRGESDRIESESLSFFNSVYEAYHQAIKKQPNVIIINAEQSMQDVEETIIKHLQCFLEQ